MQVTGSALRLDWFTCLCPVPSGSSALRNMHMSEQSDHMHAMFLFMSRSLLGCLSACRMSLEGLRACLLAFEDEALEAVSQLHRRIDFLSAKIFNFWAQHCHLSRRVALLEGLPQDTDTTARPIDLHSLD